MMGYWGNSPYDGEIKALQKQQPPSFEPGKQLSPLQTATLNILLERRRGWHERDSLVRELVEALESISDPEGHIWHGGNAQCTGECKQVQAALANTRMEKGGDDG